MLIIDRLLMQLRSKPKGRLLREPSPATPAAQSATSRPMTPSIRATAISKEETTTLARHFMALAILAAVRMQAGATGYISRTRALCTWIRRIRSRACLASSHTALWTFSLGMSLITSSLGLGHKREVRAHTNATSPVWKVDLRAVGFTGFAPTKETWGLHLKPNPLCFSDNKTLVATFISREDVTTLARRDTSGDARPDRLHGIFLNAQMGKVQGTKEWSVPRPRGGIIPTGNGRFVVLTPSMIALYSPAFELLQDFKFSSEQLSHLWDVHTSLSGKSILVEYHYPEATYQWLDSDTLQPLDARWSQSLPVLSISDDREIASFKNTYVQAKGSISLKPSFSRGTVLSELSVVSTMDRETVAAIPNLSAMTYWHSGCHTGSAWCQRPSGTHFSRLPSMRMSGLGVRCIRLPTASDSQ